MKIRSRNGTLPNAWRHRAPAAAPERRRHFGIRDVVPPELRPEVICRAETAQHRGLEWLSSAKCPAGLLKTENQDRQRHRGFRARSHRGVAGGGIRYADNCKRVLLQLHAAVRAWDRQDRDVATSCPGQLRRAAALRQALCVESQAEVLSCLTDSHSSRAELTAWGDVAKSLNKGCFVEQDTATLLCGILGVAIYFIANAGIDLQVTKYADPEIPAADCLWLYVTGNHYQVVGPMQQLVLMKMEARSSNSC
ncbi:TPA: hypothetical protein ACH3X1_012303 [Trebouxia sp. C0004]